MAEYSTSDLTSNGFKFLPDPDFIPDNFDTLISAALPLARAPISGKRFAAIGYGSSGNFYVGVNIELRGLPIQYSINAEQFLAFNLALNGEERLEYLAISAVRSYFQAPSGSCCQFLMEIRDAPNTQVWIKDLTFPEGTFIPLSDFLPQIHTAYHIFPLNLPRLLDNLHNNLTLLDPNANRVICTGSDQCGHLNCKALKAANRSYAPYSKCPSGVALMDVKEKVYSGWYMESVGYSPSLGPVQAALVDFVANGGGQEFYNIVKAVLVEKMDAISKQYDTAKIILNSIAHACDFTVLHCYQCD